jgi:hypothetical protein
MREGLEKRGSTFRFPFSAAPHEFIGSVRSYAVQPAGAATQAIPNGNVRYDERAAVRHAQLDILNSFLALTASTSGTANGRQLVVHHRGSAGFDSIEMTSGGCFGDIKIQA